MRLASIMFILSRFAEYWFRLPVLDASHGWNALWSQEVCIMDVLPHQENWIALLTCRETRPSKRGLFKCLSWAFVRNAMGRGWGMAPFEWRWLSRAVRACCWGRVTILIHALSNNFFRWRWMGMIPAMTSTPLVSEVWKTPGFQPFLHFG